MTKRTQRPSVIIRTYDQAATILNEYDESRAHLQSLVERFIPDGNIIIDSADHDYLKHCGRTIQGVARKILESNELMEKIKKLSTTKDEAERGLLEERICIQLEEQSLARSHRNYLIAQYDKIKTK